MLTGIEGVLVSERPDWLVIYGDTNSTLAGALAAAKVHVPIAHIEAGLRSFNRRMPEEINRVVADHVSTVLLCPSETAVRNLAVEGVLANVHMVGDVMLDVLNWALERTRARREILQRLGVEERRYLLATVHRGENTDDLERLAGIVGALNAVGEPVVFAVHPRTRKAIAAASLQLRGHVQLIDPVGYLDMVTLAANARMILTDSGGLQKEAYWLGTPCVTLRDETEWVETVEAGWNVLAGAEANAIVRVVQSFRAPAARPALYGDGAAARHCVERLEDARVAPVSMDEGAHAVSAAGPMAAVRI
jgi:UDP-N-acetylglucosamine 2-epimerase